MAKEKTNWEWGARSAIQKAIRRADGAMLLQAFTQLWHADNSWLMSRIPVLSAEESWRTMAYIAGMMDEVKKLKKEQRQKYAKVKCLTALKALCTMDKDHSGGGLSSLACLKAFQPYELEVNDPLRHRQLTAMRGLWEHCENGHTKKVWAHLTKRAREHGGEDVMRAVQYAKYRSSWGMEGDQRLMVAVSILWLTEEDLSLPHDVEVDFSKKREGDWPWYVYDMHTVMGKEAMRHAMDVHGIRSWPWMNHVWFFHESNIVAYEDSRADWAELETKHFAYKFKMSRAKWRESPIRDTIAAYTEGRLK